MVDLKEITKRQEQARSCRKKGDALRNRPGGEDAARKAYLDGVTALAEALEMLRPERQHLEAMNPPLAEEQAAVVSELVETFGALGGMRQRLGELKAAFDNYSEGAILEQRFSLPGTYNRLNAVKYSLLAGEKRLGEVVPQIRNLATHIETSLRADRSMSDSGWAWADLGDCLALLGKPDEARRAYSTFIAKAEIKSPERTLDVLKEIATKLKESADPDSSRFQSAIDILQSGLSIR